MRKHRIALFLTAILLLALLTGCTANKKSPIDAANNGQRYEADVLKVEIRDEVDPELGGHYIYQTLTVKPVEGPYKGKTLTAEVSTDISNSKSYYTYHAGDRVKLDIYLTESGEIESISVYTLVRIPYILGLTLLLLALIGVVGRKKGVFTMIALVLTMISVFAVLLPLIANGADPVFSAMWVCSVLTFVTMFMVGGLNRKSLAASLGTIGGMLCTYVITVVMNALVRVPAVELESVDMLMVNGLGMTFDFSGIIVAGILVGAKGAMMDVSMDIASSMNEIRAVNPERTRKQLFTSGMNVGRDIMGTMSNTLILAYTGSSLMLMINWTVFSESFVDMLNSGYIAIEVVTALCGSIGVVMTIPLTALIASALISRQKTGTPVPDEAALEADMPETIEIAAEAGPKSPAEIPEDGLSAGVKTAKTEDPGI
jgi:uncharacterized membrane protein